MKRIDIGDVQLLVSYTLRHDVEEDDYELWVKQTAVPWWENQPGFRSLRGFTTMVGSGARITVQIDFDHLESLIKVLGTDGFGDMRRELNRFAVDIDSRILQPSGRPRG